MTEAVSRDLDRRKYVNIGLSCTKWSVSVLAAVVLSVSYGRAQDLNVTYSIGFTTNYLSKGLTQTEDRAAVQPGIDIQYGIGYLNFWGSNASFGGVNDIELDISAGIRPVFGALSLDIGYAQYLYRVDELDYGEAHIFGNYTLSDAGSLNFKYYYDVYRHFDWLYVGGSYSGLPWDISLSGGIGTDFGTRGLSEDSISADFGVSKSLNEYSNFDLRLHDNSVEGTRLIATISFSK